MVLREDLVSRKRHPVDITSLRYDAIASLPILFHLLLLSPPSLVNAVVYKDTERDTYDETNYHIGYDVAVLGRAISHQDYLLLNTQTA